MRATIWGILAGALLLASAAWAAPAGQGQRPCDRYCQVQRFIDRNVGIPVDRPVTLNQLRKFAKVVSETTTKEGTHGLSDTIHIFTYAGLEVRVEVTAENSVLIQTIGMTGGKYPLSHDIKLGKIGPNELESVFGAPTEIRQASGQAKRWVYQNLQGTAAVAFDRTDDAIVAVHWDFSPGD
jgi:hypothetical protein